MNAAALRTWLARAQAWHNRYLGGALPYLVAFAVVLAVLVFGRKFWAANDDAHMAMLVHGYGMSAAPSAGIVYSNVVLGWIAMRLHGLGGLQGYSLVAYTLLILSCAALCFALHRCRVPGPAGAGVALMMFVPALLEMQFSLTAGYLAVAGLAMACAAAEGRARWSWLAAAALVVLSALVRFEECLFVCGVGLPFCALRFLRDADGGQRSRWLAAAGGAALAICAAIAVNQAYYGKPEWRAFSDTNHLRKPFTDYGLSRYYMSHPEALAAHGLSRNDMRMLGNWFFLDAAVFDQAHLGALLKTLPRDERLAFNLKKAASLMKPLRDRRMLFLLAVFALAAAASRHRYTALAGAVMLGLFMLLFLLMGRPGVVRIYPPAAAALACLALMTGLRARHALVSLAGLLLFAAALGNSWHDYRSHLASDRTAAAAVAEICPLKDDGPQVVWGTPDGFTDRYLYRPSSPPGGECPLQLYVVGVLALVPDSLAQFEAHTGGKALVPALLAGQPIRFLTDKARIALLTTYLQEHYSAKLTAKPEFAGRYAQRYLLQVQR
jgi:hypothetical protein